MYIVKDSNVVVLKINSDTGHANGVDFKMDTPAKIINDRTMIPIRAAAEAVGCTVGWDNVSRTVSVNDKNYSETPSTDPSGNNGENGPDENNPSNGNNSNGNSSSGNNNNPPSGSSNTVTGGTGVSGSTISVSSITTPQSQTSEQVFTINASGQIEKFESFLLDKEKIVVDIYNADMAISNSNITSTNSSIVKSIRSAQNQTEPNRITRVVFDLNSAVGYSVTMGSNKNSIIISFDKNEITNITTDTNGNKDIIRIYGKSAPAITASKAVLPFRLNIEIPNSTSSLSSEYEADDLNYVENITTQHSGNSTSVKVEVSRDIEYTVNQFDTYTEITIEKSTVENAVYDPGSNTLILENKDGLTESNFSFTDDYRNGKYIITLDGNYQSTYGYGNIAGGDSYVSGITLANNGDGKTQFTVNENSLIAHRIKVSDDEIRIQFTSPRSIYDKVVVLDPGHGGTDPGTSGNGLTEKDINLDIALKVYRLLENDSSIKVYITRIDDSYPTNVSRAKMGNQAADLFVSIHQNAATAETPHGTEVLYNNHNNEPAGNLTSKIAAQFMQNYVVSALGTESRGIKERPDLIVLNQTTVPAILIETCFLSNAGDAQIISDEANRQKVAEAIYSAIVDMLNQYNYR